ncbi:MAG: pseudouridine synthase [Floccifex porci]|uniref:pseudouridine synthase n=1 Tax=Floccifex porci TaxID=2606629 RepID=UPI0023F1BD03|nr:pseudouridine synthase [Floccifex porci]MDD7467625.1 pseudouridine synthase [Floccifex porci]
MRLDKFLADMQIGTRSEVKKLIQKGHVSINDQIVKKVDTKVDVETIVYVDGLRVDYVSYEYYLLNKPAGFLSATQDSHYPVVMELVPCIRKDVGIVGRLDKDTEGLLLLTNDGELNHRLLSSKNHVLKKYYVQVDTDIPDNAEDVFSKPIVFEEFTSLPAEFEYIDNRSAYLTICEGKYHQVKRMFEKIGCTVTYLKRVQFGSLTLDGLESGQYRTLTEGEIKDLYEY